MSSHFFTQAVITVASKVEDVLVFLKQQGLSKWIPLFEKEEINGKTLLKLTSKHLRELAVEREFDCDRILDEIRDMKKGISPSENISLKRFYSLLPCPDFRYLIKVTQVLILVHPFILFFVADLSSEVRPFCIIFSSKVMIQ